MLRRAWKGSRVETGSLVWRLLQSLGKREWWHSPELWQWRGKKCRFQICFEGRAHRNHWQAIHFSSVCYSKSLEATWTLSCRRLAITVQQSRMQACKEPGSSLCMGFSRHPVWNEKSTVQSSVYGMLLFVWGKRKQSETHTHTHPQSLDILFWVFFQSLFSLLFSFQIYDLLEGGKQ